MAEQWYIARDNKKHGPYSFAQMHKMASSGQLLPIDMVLKDGTGKWAPATQVPGLLPAVAIPVPPPLPSVPPPPAQPAQAGSQLPQALRSVVIGMASVVGIAVLLSLYGVTVALGDNADFRNQVLIFFSFAHGVAALFAIYQIARLQRYDVALLGSVLVMTLWGWYLFATIPLILTFLGIAGGLAVGFWSLNVLRQPEMRSCFRVQTAPWEQQWQRFSTPALSGIVGGGGLACMVMFGFLLWLAAAKTPASNSRGVAKAREVGQREMPESREVKSRDMPESREMKRREMPPPRKFKQREIKSRSGRSQEEIREEFGSDSTKADDKLKQVRVGMSKQEVTSVLGQPDERLPLGQGEACLYYVSAEEAIFISFDKQGRVFTVKKQDRAK